MPFIGDEEIFHDRQQVMLQSKELPIQLYLLLPLDGDIRQNTERTDSLLY